MFGMNDIFDANDESKENNEFPRIWDNDEIICATGMLSPKNKQKPLVS